jgi:HK97 family phage major capsid protein
MKHVSPLETRSAEPLETRDGDDAVAEVTAALAELREATSGLETRMDERLSSELEAFQSRLDEIEARAQRPGASGTEEDAIEVRAFTSFLRLGMERMQAEETRALRVSDQTQGGVLAPADFIADLDRNLVEMSPIRTAARVSSTASGSVKLPKRTAGLTAAWVDENEDRPETESAYGALDLTVNELAAFVDVSNTLLEDAAFDMGSELAFDFAEEFGRAEGAAMINGDGVKKPLGLLKTEGIASINSGGAAALKADGIIDLVYSLPSPYAAGAVFGMNRKTMGQVRKLKDGQGQYLWQPAVAAGQPASLLGHPVIEMPDMPDIAANATPIVFGNFNHFRIFDRVAISILRDPFSQAGKGRTRFHGRRRLAAGATKAEAFRLQKIAA